MRRLLLCACVCLLAISGATGLRASETGDEVPSDTAGGTERSAAEQSAPATAKPVIRRSTREICDTLAESAQSNALPIPFFIHLLFQESGFQPDVVSRAGAQGIAQFMPETAATVGLDNPFDPLQAIAASARLLRNLVKQFGNLGLAAAAYNAGPRRIQDWLARKDKLPEETQHYVKTITGRPAETWKGARAANPVHNLPRHAPCQEAAGLVAANVPRDPPVPSRIAAAARSRTKLAQSKVPAAHVARREKDAKGGIQLAAAGRKKHQKTVRLSLR